MCSEMTDISFLSCKARDLVKSQSEIACSLKEDMTGMETE